MKYLTIFVAFLFLLMLGCSEENILNMKEDNPLALENSEPDGVGDPPVSDVSISIILPEGVDPVNPVISVGTIPGFEFGIAFMASVTGGAGNILAEWDFGDGTIIINGTVITHTYTQAGTYTVSVFITDEVGGSIVGTASDALTLTVIGEEPQFPNHHDIYAFNVNSGETTQISSIPEAGEFNPSWAPLGLKIAHDVVRGEYPYTDPGDEHAIYITDVCSGISTALAGAEGGNDAAWSPLGWMIAFDRGPVDDLSIYMVPRIGGTPRFVVSDAVDPDWAPLANRIVFHRPSDSGIYTINRRGRFEHYITQGTQPVWSPNGRWITYASDGDIWKIRVSILGRAIGNPVNLTKDPGIGDYQPSWSYNSQTIVFQSTREADTDLYTIPAAGGTPTKLTGLVGQGDYDPAFSNLGLFVAYAGFTEPAPTTIAAKPNNLDLAK